MIDIEDAGPVRRLILNNPERKNAIPPQGWPELAAALADFESSDQRALLVTGAGGDFCSGADLAGDQFERQSATESYARMAEVGKAATALHRITKPTVAAVEGVAVGAGMNLALGCDVVIASRSARFSEIFVRRGLTVDFGGSWLLPRLVGLARARELALSGRFVDGTEAEAMGLVARVVAPAALEDEAMTLADDLARGAPLAQRFIKTALDHSFEWSFEEALAYEDQAQVIALASTDVVEGVLAFLEKRDPDFTGT
jgi:2-(1,2-epoxy-1,2-dihydrophenyl)acetyl-CoA isomerase